jgi:hypothetical protein
MDYKTNKIDKLVKCDKIMVSEFPTLKYGVIPGTELEVFDSTNYYLENELEELDYKVFQRMNKRYIQAFIEADELDPSTLFYINKDGHILMHHELTFLFLSFATPIIAAYFNGVIGELMANGFVLSDSFVCSLASERIPTEILQEIIKDRSHAITK